MTDRQESALFWFLSLLLITVATLARYWFVVTGQLNLAPDEAQYWDWSRTLQWSYYSKGPLIAFINYVGTAFLGATEFGVRAGAMVGALIMQLAVLGWIGIYLKRIRTTDTQVNRPATSKLDLLRRAIEDGIVPPVEPRV